MNNDNTKHVSSKLALYEGRIGLDIMGVLANDVRLRPVIVDGRCFISLVNLMNVFGDIEGTSYSAREFWRDEKRRLKKRKPELWEDFSQMKLMAADGKMRFTDVAPLETALRVLMYMDTPSSDRIKDLAAGVLARVTETELRYRAMNIARGMEWAADTIHAELADLDPPDSQSAHEDRGYQVSRGKDR